mmetsp:Transcript_49404/g.72471  ORF Transcript_49404/g.72471 Transcript_49404/m.72471 type:complete len:117 (-) Transcript_49404:20-370(-)
MSEKKSWSAPSDLCFVCIYWACVFVEPSLTRALCCCVITLSKPCSEYISPLVAAQFLLVCSDIGIKSISFTLTPPFLGMSLVSYESSTALPHSPPVHTEYISFSPSGSPAQDFQNH